MKKFVLSSIAVIIICACSTTTKKYSINNNHYEDLKYGFSLDLPNRKFWKIHTKLPEKWVNSSTVSQKRFLDSGRFVMVSKTSFGIIIISAKSMGQLVISAVEECDKFKLLLLEIRKKYSSDFEEKAWISKDWHLLSGNDCLVNFEFIENDIRVLATSYFKVYRRNDNVLFNIILVSNSKNFVTNYLTFTDLVLSLAINTPDGQLEVERTFEVSKESHRLMK